jgi:hypothetical protein
MSARPASGRESLSSFPAPLLAASDGEPVPASRTGPALPPGHVRAPGAVLGGQAFDTSVPNAARVYDCLIGGKENYAADRAAAAALTAAIPAAARAARDNRAFLGRVVRFLAGEAGIAQFLDIGTGLPARGSVHEVAREVNPDARVVYADHDPVVVAHARALLAGTGPGAEGVAAVQGDLESPRELTGRREVREVIDFRQPVAVLLAGVLHFLDDSANPWEITKYLTGKIAPGSYVVISHGTGDQLTPQALARAREVYAGFAPATARSRARVLSFFEGLDLVVPGLVDVQDWRPGRGLPRRPTLLWGGVGRKPGTPDSQ